MITMQDKIDTFERKGTLWIYDVTTDDIRAATQTDLRLLQRAAMNWGTARTWIEGMARDAENLHRKYMEQATKSFSKDRAA